MPKKAVKTKLQAPSHNPNRKMLFCYSSHAQTEAADSYHFSAKWDSYTFYDDLTCERVDGSVITFELPGVHPMGDSHRRDHRHIYFGKWKVVVRDDDDKSEKKIVIDEFPVYRRESEYEPDQDRIEELETRDKDQITVQEFPLDDEHLHRKSSENFGGRVKDLSKTVYTYKLEGDAQKFLEFCQKQIA